MTTEQLLHFAILDIVQTLTATGYQIVVYTNHPSHLWMRWTNVIPQTHILTKIERGAPVDKGTRYCFVAYEDNEQEEAGDTLVHTFIKEPWAVCETRWFYFFGTVNGVNSPSESALFKKHRVAPPYGPPQTKVFYPSKHPEVSSVDGYVGGGSAGDTWAETHDAPGNVSSDSGLYLIIRIWAYSYPNTWASIARSIILFDTSIIPAGSLINQAYIDLYRYQIKQDPPLNCALGIYQSFPNSNIALVKADYQHIYADLLTNKIPYAGIIPGYNRFTFTPETLSAIIPAGITKLAVREANNDAPNIEPPWLANAYFDIGFYAADTSYTARRPRLTVTYQPPL